MSRPAPRPSRGRSHIPESRLSASACAHAPLTTASRVPGRPPARKNMPQLSGRLRAALAGKSFSYSSKISVLAELDEHPYTPGPHRPEAAVGAGVILSLRLNGDTFPNSESA